MATVADSLRRSSINIQNISKTLESTKGSVASVNESVGNISRIIVTNTKIKREREIFKHNNLSINTQTNVTK